MEKMGSLLGLSSGDSGVTGYRCTVHRGAGSGATIRDVLLSQVLGLVVEYKQVLSSIMQRDNMSSNACLSVRMLICHLAHY